MNTFLKYFFGLLPSLIKGAQQLSADGKDKKQMVTDALQITAEGVGAISPEHGEAAAIAAKTAVGAIDGIVALLKETGKLAKPTFTPDVRYPVDPIKEI